MSGPGDVIAGMAPPQDNAPARNPAGWPNQRGRRGKRERDEELQDAASPGRARESLEGREADAAGERGRFSGDGDSGSGAESAQEPVSPESMNALAGYIRSSWARNKRARDVVEHRFIAALVIVGAFLGEGFALTHMIPAGSEVLAGRVLGTLDSALLAVLYYYFGGSAGSDRKTELLAGGQAGGQPAKEGT